MRHPRDVPVQVIGHTPSEAVKFDAGANHVAVRSRRVHGHRQVLRFEYLQLQRHRQPVFWAPIADPHQCLAALQHGPAGQGLQAIEISEPRSVGIQRPVAPEHLDPFAQCGIRHQGLRLDAGTDRIGHVGLQRGIGPGIAPHEITTLGAQFGLGRHQRRYSTRVGR